MPKGLGVPVGRANREDARRAADRQWAPIGAALRHPGAALAGQDLIVVGTGLEPDLVLSAYRHGLFPMGVGRNGAPPIGWWSPDPRGVLLPGRLHVSKSLAKSRRRFQVSVDTDFARVMRGCADPRRKGRWITPQIVETYLELHRRGDAHSVEVRREGRLVGGLYGICIGGLFAGESMFHREPDASKVALAALIDLVLPAGDPHRIIDVQWATEHLSSLGVVELPRGEYLRRLDVATRLEPPSWVAGPG